MSYSLCYRGLNVHPLQHFVGGGVEGDLVCSEGDYFLFCAPGREAYAMSVAS